jgi:hypothetical protein
MLGAAGVTVAVKVIDSPYTIAVVELVKTVLVEPLVIVTAAGRVDTLASYFALALYSAVKLKVPIDKVDTVKSATPDPFNAAIPSIAAPFLNVTVPSGVPPPGATAYTAAVIVTVWPYTIVGDDTVIVVSVPALPTVTVTGVSDSLPA